MAETPVFPKTPHRVRAVAKPAKTTETKKRDNVFSKSRDTREDRGTREAKTTHNPQTLSGGR